MPEDDNDDPSKDPCKKPKINSSGGFGDPFFMNYMSIKTKSEHYLKGQQYDAEITMSFFRWKGQNPTRYGGPVCLLCFLRALRFSSNLMASQN